MNWTLEVVVVPVSDVDRAKAFYAEQLGFNVDHDVEIIEGNRVIQLTPPGSGCSIVLREGTAAGMRPGSLKGLAAGRSRRPCGAGSARGARSRSQRGRGHGRESHPEADPLDNVGFVFFGDPDGNGWAVQQIEPRLAVAAWGAARMRFLRRVPLFVIAARKRTRANNGSSTQPLWAKKPSFARASPSMLSFGCHPPPCKAEALWALAELGHNRVMPPTR